MTAIHVSDNHIIGATQADLDRLRARYADPMLDLSPLVEPTYEPEQSLADRYAAFISANPNVLDVFEALTAQWLNAGHDRVGLKAVAEKARWESGLRMSAEWKINNSFVAFIARDLLVRRPEWSNAITTRAQRAA